MGLIIGTFCDTTTALLMMSVNFLIDNKPLTFLPEKTPPRQLLIHVGECMFGRIMEQVRVHNQKKEAQ
jgi:hypothetical protein